MSRGSALAGGPGRSYHASAFPSPSALPPPCPCAAAAGSATGHGLRPSRPGLSGAPRLAASCRRARTREPAASAHVRPAAGKRLRLSAASPPPPGSARGGRGGPALRMLWRVCSGLAGRWVRVRASSLPGGPGSELRPGAVWGSVTLSGGGLPSAHGVGSLTPQPGAYTSVRWLSGKSSPCTSK